MMIFPTSFDLRLAVARTLRLLAEWHEEDRTPDELYALANLVQTDDLTMCCPMCQEVRCDDDCPLSPQRKGA